MPSISQLVAGAITETYRVGGDCFLMVGSRPYSVALPTDFGRTRVVKFCRVRHRRSRGYRIGFQGRTLCRHVLCSWSMARFACDSEFCNVRVRLRLTMHVDARASLCDMAFDASKIPAPFRFSERGLWRADEDRIDGHPAICFVEPDDG